MDAAVLFLSPYLQDARALSLMLAEASILLIHATSLKDAADKIRSHSFRAVLTESKLDDGGWRDLLPISRANGAELVVTDPWADARFWAEAINLGAFDVLGQPFQEAEVRRVISSACLQRTYSAIRRAAS